MSRYNNAHKHTHLSNIFSSADSNTKPIDYIKRAVELGHDTYFTTEHGSFGDIFEARALCNEYGLRCVAGMEGYIVPDPNPELKDKSNYHILIIPTTNEARRKMNLISTEANESGFYYRPRLNPQSLLQLDPKDIYISTACIAGLLCDDRSYSELFVPLAKHFGDHMLLEVQSHIHPKQIEVNQKAQRLAVATGLRLVAMNDSHYIDNSGKQERLELLKGKGITYGDEDTFDLGYYDDQIMFDRFDKQGVLSESQIEQAIKNTLVFDECEEVVLDKTIKMPTIYPELKLSERVGLLKKTVVKEFKKIKEDEGIEGDVLKKYKEGIAYEMKIIEDTNNEIHTADYFLFNYEMIKLAVEKYGGVLTRGGRGSCASFYINRILGMTQLDRFRIPIPIYPDRFASTARLLENRSLPDVDLNTESQGPFVNAARELLGENSCYPMWAPGTMQISEAFRNVCRSHGLAHDEYNEIGKSIDQYRDNPKWRPLIEEAERYVGTIISGSVHPCSFLIFSGDIRSEFGLTRFGENLCVLMTSAEADDWKYLKEDVLVVEVWGLIADTFRELGQPIIPARQLLREIKNDEKVWDLIRNKITATLNQVDTPNGTEQAYKYGVKSFVDGALIAAAIRPSFDAYRQDFLNHKPFTTGSKAVDSCLVSTNGRILFQESLMSFFEFLGVTPSESIGLIKKISKKKIKPEDFANLEERIKKTWIEKSGNDDGFESTWAMVQDCMSYGFCSAHAAATSLDMCYSAFLKTRYTYEYMTVCLNHYDGNQDKTTRLIKELDYFGIKLEGIRFGRSRAKYSYDKSKGVITKGIASIKYISDAAAEELYDLSKNTYTSFVRLLHDINEKTSVDSRQLNILTTIGFFQDYAKNKKLLDIIALYDKLGKKKVIKKTDLEKLNIEENIVRKYSAKEKDKQFREIDNLSLIEELSESIDDKQIPIRQQCQIEKEMLGYVTLVRPDINPKYYIVIEYKTYKSSSRPYVTVRSLSTGEEIKTKITQSKLYSQSPFGIYAVLRIDSFAEKPRMRKQGDEWIETGETELIISAYETIAR